MEWLGETGREATGDPWEIYLDDPEVAAPRTVVCFPCAETA
jgi:effector-binding domain-containing protein